MYITQKTKTVILTGVLFSMFSLGLLIPLVLLFWLNYWVQKNNPRSSRMLIMFDNFVRFALFLGMMLCILYALENGLDIVSREMVRHNF